LIELLAVDRLSSAAIIALAATSSNHNKPLLDPFYARGHRIGGDTRAAFDAAIAALPSAVASDGLIELLARVPDNWGLPFSPGGRVKVHGVHSPPFADAFVFIAQCQSSASCPNQVSSW